MDLICGINPVMEALSAGTRHFDRLLVVKGLRNRRISDAISRAGNLGIPLRFESRETLDRMASGIPHQGLIAVVSAKPVVSVEKILEEARTPALVVVLDATSAPSFAPPRPRARTAFFFPTATARGSRTRSAAPPRAASST
jgi:23S rRNA (guanosine2251-2'-O)-methyltransferase